MAADFLEIDIVRSLARVLLLVENNSYPFDVRVRREASALRDAGYQVTVIAPRGDGQPWVECVDSVDVYRFPAPRGGSGLLGYLGEFAYATFAMFLLALWVSVRRGFDVVHAANPPDTLFAVGAFFKLFGKRFVFDHHDLSPETYLSRFGHGRPNLVSRVLLALERCSYAVADIVVATNESYKREAMARGKKAAEQVFVVRNGPPLSFQQVDPDPVLAARAPHLIGYIGTMGPQDGVDYWLRAIREMVVTFGRRDFLAVIIGSGDAAPSLHALAKELDIEQFVWFTGRVSDAQVRTILSTVEMCVQPDPLNQLNDKSTMNKVMEYMALCKPMVAFDLVETRFSAQEAAIYATPNSELDFAEKALWLMDHPEDRARMGAFGRHRVSTALAWEYSIPNLVMAYDEGLGIKPHAASVQRV
jgi:glycosyltransferase involved in cell wall biosynthesis